MEQSQKSLRPLCQYSIPSSEEFFTNQQSKLNLEFPKEHLDLPLGQSYRTKESYPKLLSECCASQWTTTVYKNPFIHLIHNVPFNQFLSQNSEQQKTIETITKLYTTALLLLRQNVTRRRALFICEITYTHHYQCDDEGSHRMKTTFKDFIFWFHR